MWFCRWKKLNFSWFQVLSTSVVNLFEQQVAVMFLFLVLSVWRKLSRDKLELIFSEGCFRWHVWGGGRAAELHMSLLWQLQLVSSDLLIKGTAAKWPLCNGGYAMVKACAGSVAAFYFKENFYNGVIIRSNCVKLLSAAGYSATLSVHTDPPSPLSASLSSLPPPSFSFAHSLFHSDCILSIFTGCGRVGEVLLMWANVADTVVW